MESGIQTRKLYIGGMTCISCQNKIEKKLLKTVGIEKAEVSYQKGTARIIYNGDLISFRDISAIIGKLGYTLQTGGEQKTSGISRMIGLVILMVSLYVLLERFGLLNLLAPSQLADEKMSYGMLFVIGLVTSVHCIAMCGGINLSQCIPQREEKKSGFLSVLRPSFLYNLGRVLSYTGVGFLVGALGSVITFSNTMQGALKLIAGIFMVIMGINMLGIFPWLRRLNPRMPKIFAQRIHEEKRHSKSPLLIGLLNGLMPCGPLQAMQIYALSTGNPLTGALSMFLFSMGTVPLMFGLGAASSFLGRKFTGKVMTAGAVLVVVLGLSMFSQGFSLFGLGGIANVASGSDSGAQENLDIPVEDGFQIVNSTLSGRSYPAITVQAGIPVKWIIDAPPGSINGCNNRIYIDEYKIEYAFEQGENIIEFLPEETGTFSYSCWMGMIRSTITVVESDTEASGDTAAVR